MMTKAKELKAGDKVRMPWGDTGNDVMTVASLYEAKPGRGIKGAGVVVTWTDGSGSSFGKTELVEVMS